MKRSEMINVMTDELWINVKEGESDYSIANKLLNIIESAGMRPPVREKIEQHIDGVKYVEVEGWDEE